MAWANPRLLFLQAEEASANPMTVISDFVSKFDTVLSLTEDLIVEKGNRYFLLNDELRRLMKKDFFYAGLYLGKTKNETFFPSFNLLAMIARTDSNKIAVDSKTEWLFICGRDIFKRGITSISKSRKKGDYTLVLNKHGDCLGFGKILHSIDQGERNRVTVKNIVDVGDFLRRER
jgi:ribosome biogenesis protein Nip4